MKSWLWVHDLCQIFTYFSFDLKQSLSNHFFMIFTSKIFFYFKSYKKITRSRLELVLRASFVINLKNSWKYFFHIFHIKNFFYCWWNEKLTKSKWEPVLRGSFVIVSNNTKYNFLSIICHVFHIKISVWRQQEKNKIQMKSWFLVHNLCQISKYMFSYELIKTLENHFVMKFTSEIFFYCSSNKREKDQNER